MSRFIDIEPQGIRHAHALLESVVNQALSKGLFCNIHEMYLLSHSLTILKNVAEEIAKANAEISRLRDKLLQCGFSDVDVDN
jgi:hypothetical protein